MNAPHATRDAQKIAGFTLVETALAIGIIAFAFVAIVAMLPLGFANFRAAIDASTCSQIFQRVLGDAEQTDFDVLLAKGAKESDFFVLPIRYFDDQGDEITVADPSAPTAGEAAKIIYWVRVRGSNPGPADLTTDSAAHFTSLPATAGATRFNPRDSTFLAVQIATNPGALALTKELGTDAQLLWDAKKAAARGIPLATYPAVLTRNGRQRVTK